MTNKDYITSSRKQKHHFFQISLYYFEVLSSVVPTYLLSICTGLLMTVDDKGNELYLPLVLVESGICVGIYMSHK